MKGDGNLAVLLTPNDMKSAPNSLDDRSSGPAPPRAAGRRMGKDSLAHRGKKVSILHQRRLARMLLLYWFRVNPAIGVRFLVTVRNEFSRHGEDLWNVGRVEGAGGESAPRSAFRRPSVGY